MLTHPNTPERSDPITLLAWVLMGLTATELRVLAAAWDQGVLRPPNCETERAPRWDPHYGPTYSFEK